MKLIQTALGNTAEKETTTMSNKQKADWLKRNYPFEREKGRDGETFVTLKQDTDEWVKEAIYQAHCGGFPNDWIYAECEAAWVAYEETLRYSNESEPDWIHRHADSQVDVYTKPRMQWVADHCLSDLYAYAEERARDLGFEHQDMIERAGTLQYCAVAIVCEYMQAAIDSQYESETEDGDSDETVQ